MSKARELMSVFKTDMKKHKKTILTFQEYLNLAEKRPEYVFRNHFDFFHNVIKENLVPLEDKNNGDPENIGFVEYDSSKLFEEGFDNPFFSDTLLNNQLIQIVETMRNSSQQNKVYIITGPHGSGKSTFINNLLQKCEEEANSTEKQRLETLWRIDKKMATDNDKINHEETVINVPCPCHDPPILVIPKKFRKSYLEILFKNNPEFLKKLTLKRYEWVLRDNCCAICDSIFWNLFDRIGLEKTIGMLHAQAYEFNRRLSRGINVFSPDDINPDESTSHNPIIQKELDSIFNDGNRINYDYSRYAKSNYGFYVLMDIKKKNTARLEELHNIISEKIHRKEFIEENINSIFIAIMNPEDKPNKKQKSDNGTILSDDSFRDRVEEISVPRILDPQKELKVYYNTYENDIDQYFLPEVPLNFAKIIISTRMKKDMGGLREWIPDPKKYKRYCDEDLILLKMEIYKGKIPHWLMEDDKIKLDAKMRHKIISEATKKEGQNGCSSRESIRLFYKFYSPHIKSDELINMSMLVKFFQEEHEELKKNPISEKFLASVVNMYDYSLLQKIKESVFYYDKDGLENNVKDYLFAIFENIGAEKKSPYTGRVIKITGKFMEELENHVIARNISNRERDEFREKTRNEFSKALSQELDGDAKKIAETGLYKELYEKYCHGIKERILDPLFKQSTVRQALKDYGFNKFNTHDEEIKKDIKRLIKNMREKFGYTEKSAKDVCVYAIDKKLNENF